MKLFPPSSLSSLFDPSPLDESLNLSDRLTVTASSISISNDQGMLELGQAPSVSDLTGNGMDHPVMRVQPTESCYDDAQLLGEPTGKSVDFSVMSTRFTFATEVIDVASFVNSITQEDDGNFENNSFGIASTIILPQLLATPIVAMISTVSFSDDVAGNGVDNAFGRVLDINLCNRGDIKVPSRFQLSPSKLSSSNSTVLVRLLCIEQENIGVTIYCG